MEASGAERLIDAEEFQRLPDEPGYRLELVRGKVVRSPGPGPRHGQVATNVVLIVGGFVRQNDLGNLLSGGTSYVIERSPDTVRGPDVSFIARGRVSGDRLPDSYLERSPDLAIEILSPSNRPSELRQRMADLFRGGCREVWVLDPRRERVTVYDGLDSSVTIGVDEDLTSSLLPGFRCRVGEFFRSD
jgi:Uma2 family endonuclease